MNWKPWLFLILLVPVAGFVVYVFSTTVFPEITEGGDAAIASEEAIPITKPLITFVDPWKGSDEPRVVIVEYGDYACPYCRQSGEDIDRILNEFDDIRFVWKDLPSALHPGSDTAAEAAHCAKDQGKFWDYHASLFSRRELFNQTSLTLAANEMGLDLDRFGRCLSGGEKKHLIERAVNEAEALGIDGTPYFFINDERFSGQMNYEQFKEIISSL